MRRSRVHNKRRIALVATSLLIMLIITAIWFVFSQPSTGKIVTSKTGSTINTTTQSSTNTLTATHFSLEYDTQLDTLSDVSSQNPSYLEAYRLAGGQRTLSVMIRSGTKIDEESAYRLRQEQDKLYRESTASYGGQDYILMKKSDSSEIVAFVASKDKYVVVAFTSHDPLGNVNREMEAILTSFRWQ